MQNLLSHLEIRLFVIKTDVRIKEIIKCVSYLISIILKTKMIVVNKGTINPNSNIEFYYCSVHLTNKVNSRKQYLR